MIKDGEEVRYYCIYPQSNINLKTKFELQGKDWTDEEKLTKCPAPPTHYVVSAKRADILNDNFEITNPPNYYLNGDTVEAIEQNDDWVYVMYKNNKKTGWISKKDLVAK